MDRIIDLFSGCGGMSLGFEMAGYEVAFAVEKDSKAAETYRFNRSGANVFIGDITEIGSPLEAFPAAGEVVGVVGGPPCQGFSLSGDRDPKDPRNSLFMDYMRFVRAFRPKFFVMENVKGILSAKTKDGAPVKDLIVSVAGESGYNIEILVLDASDYGVPQSRIRVFFIGIRKDLPFRPEDLLPEKKTPVKKITVAEAISDLPKIEAGQGAPSMPYDAPPSNDYQRWCREGSASVENHEAMRHSARLVERFHIIKPGQSVADVPAEFSQRKRGDSGRISGKAFSQNNMRPFPDRPSPTIPAGFQSNFVHPFFDRNYTAREGARLQSFPDRYVFKGKRTNMSWDKELSQYQQIGNAVPPLLAFSIAENMKRYFKI